jgi:hypothetical protein
MLGFILRNIIEFKNNQALKSFIVSLLDLI